MFDPAVVDQLLKTSTTKVCRENTEPETSRDQVDSPRISESNEESLYCEGDETSVSSSGISFDENLSMPIFE